MKMAKRRAAKVKAPSSANKVKKYARPPDGRHGRFSPYQEQFINIAEAMTKMGATDAELAVELEVTAQTILNWRARHPEFDKACKVGKAIADARVERSLYQRAVGYTYEELTYKGEKELDKKVIKQMPPDPLSCIFWLKNRQPEQWRDRQIHEVVKDGDVEIKNARETLISRIEGISSRVAGKAPAGDEKKDLSKLN